MAPTAGESKPMYQKDEKALCFHGELLYEAKVLEVRRQDPKDKTSAHEYRVHYKGWKNTWDDWVPQDRLRKLTDDNKELANNLRRELTQQAAPKSVSKPTAGSKSRKQGSEFGSGRGSEERHSSVPAGGRGTKRGRDNDIEKVRADPVPVLPLTRDRLLEHEFQTSRIREPENPALTTTDIFKRVSIHPGSSTISDGSHTLNMTPNSNEVAATNMSGYTRRAAAVVAAQKISDSNPRRSRSSIASANKDESKSVTKRVLRNRAEQTSKRSCPSKYTRSNASIQNLDVLGDPDLDEPNSGKATVSKTIGKPTPANSTILDSDDDDEPDSPVNQPRGRRALRASLSNKGKQKEAPHQPLDDEQSTPTAFEESVDDILARSPPPDEPEFVSNWTFKNKSHLFCAPLIGGTTQEEKARIEDELIAMGKLEISEKYHPQYIKTKQEDPGNFNKLLFFQGQDPKKKLMIAGVPKDPITIDAPGSGSPFDALKFPDRLVAQINRADEETLQGWDVKALKTIPKELMLRIDPQMLARFHYDVLIKQPQSVIDKLPSDAPFFDQLPVNSRLKRPKHRQASKEESTLAKQSLHSVHRDCPPSLTVPAPASSLGSLSSHESNAASDHATPLTAHDKCNTCVQMGVKCNGQKPKCFWCNGQGYQCSFENETLTTEAAEMATRTPQAQTEVSSVMSRNRPIKVPRSRRRIISQNSAKTPTNISRPSTTELNAHPNPVFGHIVGQPKASNQYRRPKKNGPGPIGVMLRDSGPVDFIATTTNSTPLPVPPTPLSPGTGNPKSCLRTKAYKPSVPIQEESFHLRPSIRITIPDHLKNLLVDDWENVTKSLLLVPLPSQAPANYIIDVYFHEEKLNRRLGSAEADVLEEFCAGMKVYFEKSVGKILLYRFERAQLAEVRKMWESGKYPAWEGKGPGDCYGAEHLTRMLVNMPELIAQTNMDHQSVTRLKEEISKFCTWLARHSARFFCAKYEKPSAEYIEGAR